jgi:hypothetical protein
MRSPRAIMRAREPSTQSRVLSVPWPIIDAGVDDFAVARTNPGANPALAFEDDHFPSGPSQRSCDGETDEARADDQTLDRFHPSPLCSKWSVLRR